MHVDLAKQPWRFRFSLRSLFVLTTIVCLALWFIPRYLEWREYQQIKQRITRIVENMKVPSDNFSPANHDSNPIRYGGRFFLLSNTGDTFLPGQHISFIMGEAIRERPTLDSIYVSPPNAWVKRDVDSIMDLIVKTHAQPKK